MLGFQHFQTRVLFKRREGTMFFLKKREEQREELLEQFRNTRHSNAQLVDTILNIVWARREAWQQLRNQNPTTDELRDVALFAPELQREVDELRETTSEELITMMKQT